MAPIIYTYPGSFRTAKALIAAQYNGVEVKQAEGFQFGVSNKTPEYLKKFPSGTVPAMEDGDLYLSESTPIAYYVASLKNEEKLLGKDLNERVKILDWVALSDGGFQTALANWLFPLWGFLPYTKPTYTKAVEDVKKVLKLLNTALLSRTFLVGNRVTLADIALATQLQPLFVNVLSPEHRGEFKNVVRWFVTLSHQKEFKAVWGETTLCAEEKKYQAPKKEEKKPAASAPKPKPKEPEPEEDFDDVPKEPKPKSALDLLPPSKLNLEEWKRFYSNNDTKPTAMNWFWEHFDSEGYSIWKVNYKYNEELQKVFMSANLIGGFFNRLERARKYAFGSLIVLGEDNNNEIAGYFVLRGQEVPFEVYDAADYDSYTFVKVDHQDEAVKAEIADYFAWEGDFGGKKFADGKIFK